KFYATRHTFISATLMAGVVKIKRLADYCGTSVAMMERHYARWMQDDSPEELAGLGGRMGGGEATEERAVGGDRDPLRGLALDPSSPPKRDQSGTILPFGGKVQAAQGGGGEIRTPEGF